MENTDSIPKPTGVPGLAEKSDVHQDGTGAPARPLGIQEDPAESPRSSNVWTTPQGKVSPAFVRYVTQGSLSALVILVCAYMLTRDDGNAIVWVSLLSSTLGLNMPAPTPH